MIILRKKNLSCQKKVFFYQTLLSYKFLYFKSDLCFSNIMVFAKQKVEFFENFKFEKNIDEKTNL